MINCDTKEKIKEVLEKEGVNATDEEINEMIGEISKIAEAISKIDDKDMDEISGGSISDVREKLADKIYGVGCDLYVKSGAISKSYKDHNLKDKIIDKLVVNSEEIATGILGSAAAVGVIGAVAGGRIAYKKIKNWVKNKDLHK